MTLELRKPTDGARFSRWGDADSHTVPEEYIRQPESPRDELPHVFSSCSCKRETRVVVGGVIHSGSDVCHLK